jgi:hypothetical protein
MGGHCLVPVLPPHTTAACSFSAQTHTHHTECVGIGFTNTHLTRVAPRTNVELEGCY